MNLKEKVQQFKEKHPVIYDISLSVFSGVAGALTDHAIMMARYNSNRFAKKLIQRYRFFEGNEYARRDWDKRYRPNYEKFVEFAKDLDLRPCECLRVGYWVDPDDPNDKFRKEVIHDCGLDYVTHVHLD